ncbi:MAG TPA: cytochrome P450 [Solirubrobacteraceae bacterium]
MSHVFSFPCVSSRRGLPPTTPLPALLQTLACRLSPHAYLEWCRARLGERFVVYPIDMPPLVFLSNPNDIRAVFAAPPDVLHPGAGAAVAAPLFGKSSFMLQEEEGHMSVRSAISPAFRRHVVKAHAETVRRVVRKEVRSWPLEEVFPTHPALRALTLRVILRSIFGEEEALQRALHGRLLEMLSVTASLVLQEPRVRYLPGWHGTWGRFVRQREHVDELIIALIGRRRVTDAPAQDMLDMLLAMRRPDGAALSERELRDQLVSTIIAGHETTAASLAWAFQLLAHNPRVQERVAEEIATGTSQEYLTATVQEVLRHSPVFLFAVPRAVVQPIEIGGWTYRPPVHLLGCTYLMQRDPALYPEPDQFRPERFLGAPPSPRTWLPWGGGRRRCMGQHLAMLEMQAVLRAVLSERVVRPAAAHVERAGWRSVMVAPRAGSRVILGVRQRGARQPASSPLASATV